MAWRCSGSTNEELIQNMYRNGLIKSDRVKEAMLGVDRAHYSPAKPYQDSPQRIGHAATISAPHMHASACESLLPFLSPGARVLDVGSGSGYLTHVLAELVKPGGTVVGVEHIQALVDLGKGNTEKSKEGKELLQGGGIVYVKADGRKGWTGKGGEEGYDAIHVGAAAAGFHQELVDQLKAPGRLFIPVEENYMQHIYVIDKKEDGTVERKKLYGVQYVPLTDAPRE
ncbi:hypothetical protein MBLNU459_g2593t1 [Dothideomycetes sp. NU459]